MKLRYERGALSDLEEIFAYIAADNPDAAARLVARIEDVAERIAASPFLGQATRKSGFRRFPVGKYLIVSSITFDMEPAYAHGRGRQRAGPCGILCA
jgi:toxin ParE1/3/4